MLLDPLNDAMATIRNAELAGKGETLLLLVYLIAVNVPARAPSNPKERFQ